MRKGTAGRLHSELPPSSSSSFSSSSSSPSSTTSTITTPLAFEREWQRLTNAGRSAQEKLLFLRSVGGAFFISKYYIMGKKKQEMSAEVLGDLLMAMREGLKVEEEEVEEQQQQQQQQEKKEGDCSITTRMDVVKVLHALTQVDRFRITLALLSSSQVEAAKEVVTMLDKMEGNIGEEGRRQLLKEVRQAFSFC